MAAFADAEPSNLPDLESSLAFDPNNLFALPSLDENGWHPQSGTAAERSAAVEYFGLDLSRLVGDTGSNAEQRKRWYRGESPWHACLSPHKWVIEDSSPLGKASASSGGGLTRGLLSAAKSNMTFYKGHYEETIKLPVVGNRTTRWLICCYVSPTTRLVRCISGFVSKEEEKFPFALATLVSCTVYPSDPATNDLGLSYLVSLGLGSASRSGPGGGGGGAQGQCAVAQSGPRVAAFELASGVRGGARIDLSYKPFKYLNEVLKIKSAAP